ncbi:MAG: helix-turn-helix transcriptional regulator [Patescibacteria group bacterium]|jgi:transcriptional regulator with XRE-family HTH domain
MRKTIPEHIKYVRIKNNLSQDRFGKKLGLSGKTISAYEKGVITPPMRILERISEVYNITAMGVSSEKLTRLESEIKKVQESLKDIWEMIGVE